MVVYVPLFNPTDLFLLGKFGSKSPLLFCHGRAPSPLAASPRLLFVVLLARNGPDKNQAAIAP